MIKKPIEAINSNFPIFEICNFLCKEKLVEILSKKINIYKELCTDNEIIFYIIVYSKFDIRKKSITNLINILKKMTNMNINIVCNVLSITKGLMYTSKGLQIKEVEKIKIKVIINN